jgi:hypothetical protein
MELLGFDYLQILEESLPVVAFQAQLCGKLWIWLG